MQVSLCMCDLAILRAPTKAPVHSPNPSPPRLFQLQLWNSADNQDETCLVRHACLKCEQRLISREVDHRRYLS